MVAVGNNFKVALRSDFTIITWGCFPANLPLAFALRMAGRKMLLDYSWDYNLDVRNPLYTGLMFVLSHLAHMMATQKSWIPHMARKYKIDENRILPFENVPSLDTVKKHESDEPVLRFSKEKFVIAYSGNSWYHGAERFFPILKIMEDARNDILLVVFAGPAVTRNLKERQESEGVSCVVYYPNLRQSEFIPVIRQADLVIGTLDDGSSFGNGLLRTQLLESMALGSPCLNACTNAIQSYDFLVDGQNIITVNPSDAKESAEKLLFYVCRRDELRRIGVAAKETIYQHFDATKHARLIFGKLTGEVLREEAAVC
jgi:glycosyltransferase involved in cell wall biosynthesis